MTSQRKKIASKSKKLKQKSRLPLKEDARIKILLWCARHCCFCGKPCKTNIEIHHIDQNPSNTNIDNLIPLCFDCHGELTQYDIKHPKGSKYRIPEIKSRREQIYSKHTRQYLRPVNIKISKFMHHLTDRNGTPVLASRKLGDTSCTVQSLSNDIPLKIRLKIVPYQDDKPLKVRLGDLYSGTALWNLNPSQFVFGHFPLPIKKDSKPFQYRVEVFWSIIDILQREHHMLPFSFVWNDPKGDWWYDPRVLKRQDNLGRALSNHKTT